VNVEASAESGVICYRASDNNAQRVTKCRHGHTSAIEWPLSCEEGTARRVCTFTPF
jgi:hypothetical protein